MRFYLIASCGLLVKENDQRLDETGKETGALSLFAGAAYAYLQEIEECRALCVLHEKTAAIHQRGQSSQVYRMFKRDEVTARYLRKATDELPPWERMGFIGTRGHTQNGKAQ